MRTGVARRRDTLWTPANVITCARVALVPIWLAVAEGARGGGTLLGWLAFALYVVISLSDKLDGWLARSRGETTTFGKFLDPVADKLAVIVALLFLLEVEEVTSWVVLIVVSRELLVDGLRMVAASRGMVIPAGTLGKWKTALTMVSICTLLLWGALTHYLHPQVSGALASLHAAGVCLLFVSLILTVWSGVDYFVKVWPAIRTGV